MKYVKYSIIPKPPIRIRRATRPVFKPSIDKETVINVVCNHFGVSYDEVNTDSRKHPYPYIRFIIMTFLREYSLPSLKKVGEVFNRDHTSVMHGLASLRDWTETDEEKQREVNYLKERLQSVN